MSAESDNSVTSRLFDVVEESDLRIVLFTLGFVYLLFAVLIVLEQGLSLDTLNPIAGAWQTITFLGAAYAILALALNLQWGYAGMFNIGIAGFMAVGVYTMALLSTPADAVSGMGLGLPLPIGIIGGMVAAGLIGLLAAIPALRLRADYLAIVTLGLSEIIRLTAASRDVSQWTEEYLNFGTGGGSGIALPSRPTDALFETSAGEALIDLFVVEIAGEEVELVTASIVRRFTWVVVMIIVMLGIYWVLLRIGYSPFGRVLKAIREDELVAQSLGKDTRLFKIKIFMLGCALMGLGGILWQGSQGFTSPDSFEPVVTFYIFIALIIGGSGSNTGSVVGGILFAALLFEGPRQIGSILEARIGFDETPGTFRGAAEGLVSLDIVPFLAYVVDNLAPLQFVFLGIVLVVLVQKRPQGMLGHRTETAAATDLRKRSQKGEEDE